MERSVVSLPLGEKGKPEGRPAAPRWNGRLIWLAGGRAPLLKAFFLGVTLTAVFYEVFPLPFVGPGRLLSIFDNAVSEAIVVLAAWALFFLALKALRHRNEARAFRALSAPGALAEFEGGLPASGEPGVAARFAETMRRGRVREPGETLIARRLVAIARMAGPQGGGQSHGNAALHANMLAQAEIDAKKLDLSYAAVHVFIWAIPIFGFIGTVVGIGDAILDFSRFVQSADPSGMIGGQMREALGGVTSGLALAFNTTFLALALVIPLMLGASLLQKAEEELLLAVDEFFLWESGRIFGRYPEGAGRAGEPAPAAPEWIARVERAGSQFAQQVELAGHQLAGVQPLIKEFTDRLMEAPDRTAKPSGTAAPASLEHQAAAPGPSGSKA